MGETRDSVTSRQLAVVLIGLAILLGAYFAIRRYMQPPTEASVDEGRASADAFLNLIRDGKADEAWDASTTEFKSIEGRESFVRKATTAAILKEPLSFSSMQKVVVGKAPRSEFLYSSTKSGGTVRVLIGYEGGGWKVDRLTL